MPVHHSGGTGQRWIIAAHWTAYLVREPDTNDFLIEFGNVGASTWRYIAEEGEGAILSGHCSIREEDVKKFLIQFGNASDPLWSYISAEGISGEVEGWHTGSQVWLQAYVNG